MATVHALAAKAAKGKLEPYEFSLGELPSEQVEIGVEWCGICHSDLSVLDNEWGISQYPFVPGHEVVGTVRAVGSHVKRIKVGDRVGLGWYSGSCNTCRQCMSGDHNLCPTAEATMLGRPGGFATVVRCHENWAALLPAGIDPATAGPLFCGGITVFNPMVQFDIKPTDRVGVIGIGGLGHMALKFLRAWGCEVTAFTSSESKREEAMRLGAHRVVNSRDSAAMKGLTGSFDFILNTANADLDWPTLFDALAPRGRLHTVGVVPNPIPMPSFNAIVAQRSMSGSPLGSPATVMKMLDFAQRHGIGPQTELFPMSQANAALDHLRAGKARYRIVLKQDLA
jgi:alcohol/geraniol dehydrogenase (NADP+)